LAIQHKSDNLGQGFPDWESPDFVKNAMCKSIQNNFNQYCRSRGDVALVTALSNHYSPLVGRIINPLTEITISVGATEGLFAIMQAYLNPGDEVVTFEPAFDM
jgi:aspartate/methionine/tyrosine aminotransferase